MESHYIDLFREEYLDIMSLPVVLNHRIPVIMSQSINMGLLFVSFTFNLHFEMHALVTKNSSWISVGKVSPTECFEVINEPFMKTLNWVTCHDAPNKDYDTFDHDELNEASYAEKDLISVACASCLTWKPARWTCRIGMMAIAAACIIMSCLFSWGTLWWLL